MTEISGLAAKLFRKAAGGRRLVVGIAGPPGAGKSTFADALVQLLPQSSAVVVPMDGFHLDNAVLAPRMLLERRGAPETYDFDGFRHMIERIRRADGDVAVPLFDRGMDLARAGAGIVRGEHRFVIVEGNYLLLDESPWYGLAPLFDHTVFLEVHADELERRLIARWLDQGLPLDAARRRAVGNDLPNARRVTRSLRKPDTIISL